jgi:hypothetical protein
MTKRSTSPEYRRNYYRTHPEFQARQRAASLRNHARNNEYPEYRKLAALRKDVHRIRESMEARLAHAARLEARLVKLGRELFRAEIAWAKVKPNEKK